MPSALSLRQHPTHALALLAIAGTAATCMTTVTSVKPEYGMGLALLLLPFAGRDVWRAMLRHPFTRIVLLFVAYAAVQTVYLHLHGGESLQHFAAATSKPVKLGVFGLAAGIWLSMYPGMIGGALVLMLLGLLVQTGVGIAAIGLPALLVHHVRLTIGYPTNLGAMFFAMAAVALVLAAIRNASDPRPGAHRTWLFGACVGAAAFFFLCLALSGTRGAWIAALAAIVACVVPYLRQRLRMAGPRQRQFRWALAIIAVAFIVTATIALAGLAASGRIDGFWKVPDRLLDGDSGGAPMSSVGIRLRLLAYGLALFGHHPLFGEGLASIAALIKQTDIHMGSFVPAHMHNAYLQALVGLGGLGSVMLLGGAIVLARDHLRNPRRGLLWHTLAAVMIVAAVANLSDSLVWRLVESRVPFEVLLACVLGLSLRLPQPGRGDGVAASAMAQPGVSAGACGRAAVAVDRVGTWGDLGRRWFRT